MYSQFLDNLTGGQLYLICSLWIFLIFFIVVSIMLFRLKKPFVTYMSDLPLEDDDTSNTFKPLQS